MNYLQKGFTLIELLVAVAILAILTAIAIPSYQQYIVRSNRSSAQAFMVNVENREKQYMLDARAYWPVSSGTMVNDFNTLGVVMPDKVSKNYDVLVAVTSAPPAFTITASPKAGTRQAADGSLTLDSLGVKTPLAKW